MPVASHVSFSYNQLEEDFASLQEYNDYLEEVETIGEHSCTAVEVWWPCVLVQCSTCVMEWMWRPLGRGWSVTVGTIKPSL